MSSQAQLGDPKDKTMLQKHPGAKVHRPPCSCHSVFQGLPIPPTLGSSSVPHSPQQELGQVPLWGTVAVLSRWDSISLPTGNIREPRSKGFSLPQRCI